MSQMKVKSGPFFQYNYVILDAAGNPLIKRSPNPGTEGLAFDQYVDPSGNTWVRLAGTTSFGGVSPTGVVVPVLADALGNMRTALPNGPAGTAPLNSTSTVYESSRLGKPTPGVLMGISGYNSKTATQFVLVLDYAGFGIPPNATIPAVIIAVAASSNFSYDPGSFGRAFNNGLWIVNSSTGPTLTIGSADCFFDVQYV